MIGRFIRYDSIDVTSIDKMWKNRLRWWLGYVIGKEETEAVRLVFKLNVCSRGIPKNRWLEVIMSDMKLVGVREDDMGVWIE